MDEYRGYAREALAVLRQKSLAPPDQAQLRQHRANDLSFPSPQAVPSLSNEEIQAFASATSERSDAVWPEFPDHPGHDVFEGVLEARESHADRERLAQRNALLGSHDPHLFKDEERGVYYASSSGPGGSLRRSKDLVHWESVGKGLKFDVPKQAIAWCDYSDRFQPRGIWAPEVHRVGDQYRMYYSVSTSCHRRSYIGLAVSNNPEGPYEDLGEVVKTDENAPVNAIDPSLVIDAETGEHFMNYGSYWNGIAQIQLDPATGLRLENGQPYYGRLVWKRHHDAYREIEGSYEIYNPDTGYYYLFTSYDSTVTDYNIRVARSKNLGGPFYDSMGRLVSDTHTGVDPDAIGLKIADCYQFEDHFGWCATGHNGLLKDGENYYISFHARPQCNLHCAAMHIRLMIFDRDGWPLMSPCQYAGEKLQKIDPSCIPGVYERIVLDKPDGVHLCRQSTRIYLQQNGQALIDGRLGTWEMTGDYEMTFRTGDMVEYVYVIPGFDAERGVPTLALTGRRSDGICTWGKKRKEVPV